LIDLHCHILPSLDDGAGSLEESLAMGRIAMEDGIHKMVASPHTMNGLFENPLGTVQQEVARLQEAFQEAGILIELIAGSDTHLCPGLVAHIERGEAVTIGNMGKYLLLELPSQAVPPQVKDEIFALKLNGITPIITHPERNLLILNEPERLEEMLSMGALSQITARSLTGGFGEGALRGAVHLLKQGLVHVIASDGHSADYRPPILSRAVDAAARVLRSREEAERMVRDTPGAILEGIDVPV
jgi:protein-tyrosine phosphatase